MLVVVLTETDVTSVHCEVFRDKLPHCVWRGIWSGSCSWLMDVLTALAETVVELGAVAAAAAAVRVVEDRPCSQSALSTYTSLNPGRLTADCNKKTCILQRTRRQMLPSRCKEPPRAPCAGRRAAVGCRSPL